MIRWIVIVVLFFLVLEYESKLAGSVSREDQRDDFTSLVQHVCHRTSKLPDELERCQYVGIRSARRLTE